MSIATTFASAAPAPHLTDKLWFNALWFQGVWFCTVLGQAPFLPVAVGLLVLHLWLVRNRWLEARQLVCVGAVGIGADALLSVSGVYVFAGGVLLPLWLCCLWLAFAAVLGRSLAYLGRNPLLAALAGAVAFPLNYWAGQRLGAVEFGYSLPLTLGLLALAWGILLPLMYRLTLRLAAAEGR